ncbi:MAG: transglutaminase-like cysteine peptidase [Hyphomicrobiales bacterium]
MELKLSANPAVARWRKFVLKEAFLETVETKLETIQYVNTTINASVRYASDYRHFHKTDFWATAETTLAEGGDCEDFALLKSTTLDWLGWPVFRKHLLIGVLHREPPRLDEAHAVLIIEFENDPTHWVMDSIGDTLIPLSEFKFTPLHAVDSQTGLRLFLKTRKRRHN